MMIDKDTTISEMLFQEFCDKRKIIFEKISTGEDRTPDYSVFICGNEIIVEVKQIDMNPKEQQEYKKFREGEMAAGRNTIGKRVGKKITDANQQLSKLTMGKLPSLCIIYDNTHLGYHTDPNNIRFGMYGLPTAIISKSMDSRFKSSIIDWRFGKNRKMTREANTNTSVVAAMFREIDNPEHPPYLVAYHNVYAKIKLKSEILKRIGVRQFTLNEDAVGNYQEWHEILD
jgi:hypothetical protein